MLRPIFTPALVALLLFEAAWAQVPASAPQSAAYAYSIQYVPSDGRVKYAFRKVDTYDRISQYLQERISKLLEERGLHLAKPSDPAAFRVTVQLVKAKASDVESNPLRTFGSAGVFLTADISIADGSGNLLFTHEYKAKGLVHSEQPKRVVVVAADAANDLVRQLDNEDSFNKVFSAPTRVSARDADQTPVTPVVDGRPVAAPRSVLLPAGTPVIVAFSDEVLLPLTPYSESSKTNTKNVRGGDPVSLVLAEDIKVGDAVVAKTGSKVAGNVFERPFTKTQKFFGGGVGGLAPILFT